MRIALVEPPREAQDSIASLLGRQGHEVLSFPDANEALKELKSDPAIDALIAGAQVGSISGAKLCSEARRVADDAKRPLYVLLMSSNTDPAARAEAFDCGVDDIIAKPPPRDELREKLHVAQRMIALERELTRLATTDRLTGTLNRSAFFDQITRACTQATNGDALSILLKGHDLAQALKVAGEVHRRLGEVKLRTADGILSLTCGLGVGGFHVGDAVDDLIKRADLALYRAKDEGRDCVRSTPPRILDEPTSASRRQPRAAAEHAGARGEGKAERLAPWRRALRARLRHYRPVDRGGPHRGSGRADHDAEADGGGRPSAGLALLSRPSLARTMIDLPLPGGPDGRELTTTFPEKGPMIPSAHPGAIAGDAV